ncbi:MAG: hypothetical protein ACTHJL_02530 [Amnibacterium sp.]
MRIRTLAVALLTAAGGAGLAGCAAFTSGDPMADPPVPLAAPASQIPSPTAVDPAEEGPTMPTPKPGATVDPAAAAKVARWVAGARVPPGAVKTSHPPEGTTIDDENQGWWCEPMAEADAYWRLPSMDLSRTANWLRAHPSNGLKLVGPGDEAPDPNLPNASVNDVPSPTAFQGMTFEIASWGPHGSVIHLQVGVLAKDSVCATAAPGTGLMTAGG